ncbi:MAG: MFS transporter [Proteobacteria bacterium]|nr:MFS transporter [Pseudomonadota bacterium]
MVQLLLVLAALIVATILLHHYSGLPRNITVLFLAQPLISSAAPIMVFIGGIISIQLAPDPGLATLPLSLMIAGTASATIPAAMLAKRFGRRNATILGFSCTIIGSLLAIYSISHQLFWLFVLSAYILGLSSSFSLQLRFAAVESLDDPQQISKALSVLMFTGIFSAMIGPEIVVLSKDVITSSAEFTGSFYALLLLASLSIIVMFWFKNPPEPIEKIIAETRPVKQIIKQPIFIIALLTGALGFGLMSFVMTATPLSMNQIHGHSLEETKWVIQSHIIAMFLPSLLTTWLEKNIGIRFILLIGSFMFVAVIVIALLGYSVMHYWWALIMLGIAWNFLFFSGTSLLTRSYHNHEKHKIQAINDFSIVSFQGMSSLLAGWVLFQYGWQGVVYVSIPFVLIMLIITAYNFHLPNPDLVQQDK